MLEVLYHCAKFGGARISPAASLPPWLPTFDSIRGFAHAAGFASAWRCLRFLVMASLCNRGAIIFVPCSFFLLLSIYLYFFLLA